MSGTGRGVGESGERIGLSSASTYPDQVANEPYGYE